MRLIDGHGVILDAEPASRADALSAARTHLTKLGVHPLGADEALARARVEMVWWSDTAGFVHDCAQHLAEEATKQTCPSDRRRVAMVLGLAPLGVSDV